ncbi:MAG: cell division protein SepF [Clostridiales bacterium]|nr:cell division protein SepF [Clostridiales bacterium]
MGMFDNLFGKGGRTQTAETNDRLERSFTPTTEISNRIAIFTPKSFDDVQKIIDEMRNGLTVMVHLTALKTDTAIRVLDLLSGAIYALGGGVYEVQKNTFMFNPGGVEVR